MSDVLTVIWHGFRDSLLMVWEVWWALVFGFAISAAVQAWVPRERVERALGRRGPRAIAVATGLGAASSSCSYAAIAIARSLFEKGASAASALAFQIASTNLVWELGLVLWVLLGWQFTLAEYLGGIVMIVLIALALRLVVSAQAELDAREHVARASPAASADHPDDGYGCVGEKPAHPGAEQRRHHESHGKRRVLAGGALTDVAQFFHSDWRMLWKEIATGFLLAGFIAQLGNGFFERLFVEHAPHPIPAIENALVGPLIAVLSFVCSIGNVPLAAVLWSGGISFAGVLSFLFADLIVLPIIAIYRKYYGTAYALRITILMFLTMAIAALLIGWLFGLLGAIPSGSRPTRRAIFGSIGLNYKLVLNALALGTFGALTWLRFRRRAGDLTAVSQPQA